MPRHVARLRSGSRGIFAACWLAWAAARGGHAVAADLSTNGGEFQVNTYTAGWQYHTRVAADPQGNFVVVWAGFGLAGSASMLDVHGRRYDARGVPLADQFQINTLTTEWQRDPDVAIAPDGRFVVVWQGARAVAPGFQETTVAARRYDANGVPMGDEFRVDSYPTGNRFHPAVAMDPNGGFVVTWYSFGSSGTDSDESSIQAKRYDANGLALGGEFQVNTYTTGREGSSAVAVTSQGDFLIVWARAIADGSISGAWSLWAQRYDHDGTPVGTEFQVDEGLTGSPFTPSIATDSEHYFVAWVSLDGTTNDSYEIYARGLALDGVASGPQFRVNTHTPTYQFSPRIAADPEGNFVIVWEGKASAGTDQAGFSVHGQRYDANGAPRGGEFQINTYTTNDQRYPAVASDADGNFVVAWQSVAGPFTGDVKAQRYDAVFREDFEAGNVDRWTSRIP
ncbi:MAG: hypothetical protein U0610_25990 [bacterium]